MKMNFSIFAKFAQTLNKHSPRKRKAIRGNQSPFINKEISKVTMKRNELRNKFLKHEPDESRQVFVKQLNYMSLF